MLVLPVTYLDASQRPDLATVQDALFKPEPHCGAASTRTEHTPRMGDIDWPAWPQDWPARKAGTGCQLCGFLQTEDPARGIRVYTGRAANAYLWARGQI